MTAHEQLLHTIDILNRADHDCKFEDGCPACGELWELEHETTERERQVLHDLDEITKEVELKLENE